MRKSDKREVLARVLELEEYLAQQCADGNYAEPHEKVLKIARELHQSLEENDLDNARGHTNDLYRIGTDSLPWTEELLGKLNYLYKHVPRL